MTWTDGAQTGVGAEEAMKACIGGEQPTKTETVEEMATRIREAPIVSESYDGCATATARIILEAMEMYPELQNQPTETPYLKGPDGKLAFSHDGGLIPTGRDLGDVLRKLHAEDSPQAIVLGELSGFQWGWAVNAARRCLSLSEKPNPALLTIG